MCENNSLEALLSTYQFYELSENDLNETMLRMFTELKEIMTQVVSKIQANMKIK